MSTGKLRLRFAEAVCPGHPDRLADSIADGLVALACERDPRALVGVEVALHRGVVFVDGRIAAGTRTDCAVTDADVVSVVKHALRGAGYGKSPSGFFAPDPDSVEVRLDLCLGPLDAEERDFRDYSDDQVIAVGHACRGQRAGWRPLEQALASDFVGALTRLRRERPELGLGPDGKALVAVRGQTLESVSLSVHHRQDASWLDLTSEARSACIEVAEEYVAAGELEPLGPSGDAVDWLVNGAGAFEVGGPMGDNGLSGKKLVAEAFGTSVPIGGGTLHGKDPLKPDVRGQLIARARALKLVVSGQAREATVWVVFRPGEKEPRWIEEEVVQGEIALCEDLKCALA